MLSIHQHLPCFPSVSTLFADEPYFVRSTPDAVATDVAANSKMFGYLEALTSAPSIPGFNASGLASKYGIPGRNQILTQIYDYIRIVNKLDKQLTNANQFAQQQTVPPTKRTVGGQDTFGFGRFPTVNQIAVHFICTADASVPASNVPANLSLRNSPGDTNPTLLTPGQKNIMAMVYLEVAMPAAGFPNAQYDDMTFTVTGLDQLTLNGLSLGLPGNATATIRPWPTSINIGSATNMNGGYAGGVLKYLVFFCDGTKTFSPGARAGFSESGKYPLASGSVRVTGGNMTVGSATLGVDVRWPKTATDPSHSVSIPWTQASVPTPSLPADQNLWVFDQVGWNGGNGTDAGRLPRDNATVWEPTRLFLPTDTLVAVASTHGDFRINMVRPVVAANWGMVPFLASAPGFAHRLYSTNDKTSIPNANIETKFMDILDVGINEKLRTPVPPKAYLDGLNLAHPLTYGDFDNGLPALADGAYINAPDEVGGWTIPANSGNTGKRGFYWESGLVVSDLNLNENFLTPNRKIASAIAFGSLPSAAMQDRPWQTLLFRPAPEVTNHPGRAGFGISGTASAQAPADHHWLDFFWMPMVEPYAISETFSTAGKINMNHRIAPFSYINRTTAVESVLGSSGVTAVPSTAASYTNGFFRKITSSGPNIGTYLNFESAFPVNATETLKGFSARLDANSLFRSASEICELPIVPTATGATYASLQSGAWWNDFRYTGDNTREATYNDIYPRLTTRSNTYTVHYRVQVLKKLPGGTQTVWDETKDKVLSELRGSTLIERYLDPNAIYPDYANSFTGAESLETFYRFRVLQRTDFTP